ncbi:MAG: hypothetical protein ACK4UJ_01175 [Leptonema sp. (in: bacteria)]
MNKEIFVIVFLVLLMCILSNCKTKKSNPTDIVPDTKIQYSREGGKLKFIIEIPKDHHAYLDSGKDNSLIPIQFNWNPLVQNKILTKEPKLLSKPSGEYDEEVRATVLRKKGEFVFFLPEEEINKIKDQSIFIKVQICNEVTGICFRPKEYEVKF